MKLFVHFVLVLVAILAEDSTAQAGFYHQGIFYGYNFQASQQLYQPLDTHVPEPYPPYQVPMNTVPMNLETTYAIPPLLAPLYPSLVNKVPTDLGTPYLGPMNSETSYSIPSNAETTYIFPMNLYKAYSAPMVSRSANLGKSYPTSPSSVEHALSLKELHSMAMNPVLMNSLETSPVPKNENQTNPEQWNPVPTNSGKINLLQKYPEFGTTLTNINTGGVIGHVGDGNGAQRNIIVGVQSKRPEYETIVSTNLNSGGIKGHVGDGSSSQQSIFVGVTSTSQKGEPALNSTSVGQQVPSDKL